MTFSPTPEQLAIVEAARNTSDNLLISALAGAAKTSTLLLVAQALPKVNMLCLAFNKKIADEMKERLPSHCTAMTLNGLGHRAWAEVLGRRLTLQNNKCYQILSEAIEKLDSADRSDAYEGMGDMLKACQQAKAAGHVPDIIAASRKHERLASDDDIFDLFEELFSDLEKELILSTLLESMHQAFAGIIDFSDQLLMPTVFRAIFPPFSLILVDEAQDLSELNHAMLKKLVRKRIIAVGDQCQAIYAFRGAHESGMSELKAKFSMTELTLSTSFRCPKAIVEHVRWRAPHMNYWAGNPFPGEVVRTKSWSLDQVPDDAAIICRNNAPLFSIAIQLLKSGRYPNLWGNDIGRGMIKVMEKLGPGSMKRSAALGALSEWHDTQSKKVKNQALLADRVNCIRVFLDATETLAAAVTYCEHVLRSQGRVNLMTGHRSKGHEFDHIFFLDEKAVRDEGQDLNLRYVICTRAKRTLTYINSKELETSDGQL